MFSNKKRFFFQAALFTLAIFILSACATTVKTSVMPPTDIKRTEDMPLVVGIPGLNVMPFADQRKELQYLEGVMTKMGVPSAIVLYDTKDNPTQDVADLSSKAHSVLSIRVLPRFVTLINEENAIRKEQGLPALKELVLVVYSQGGVITWDLIDRFASFKQQLEEMSERFGDEWVRFEKDPQLGALNDAILALLQINNLKIQYPEIFERAVDMRNIYFRAKQNLENSTERFRAYINDSGEYPKLNEWLKTFKPVWKGEAYSEGFFFQYAIFKNLLPLKIRILSLDSSLFGSVEANKGVFYMSFAPRLGNAIVSGAVSQLRDTRVGSPHQLDWTKELFARQSDKKIKPVVDEAYFIVGANGHKGDGMVDQPGAHLSQVRLAILPIKEILEGSGVSEIQWQELNKAPVTGLTVDHLESGKIIKHEGVTSFQMKNSKSRPFLEAFVRKDRSALQALHEKSNKPLVQFYCSLYFPKDAGLNQKDFEMKPLGKQIKITGRYVNADANSLVWTGYFKSAKDKEASFRLTVKTKTGKREFLLKLYPGRQHFIEITA